MRPTILTLTLAALVSFGGSVFADDWKDESGKGRGRFRGGPPPWAGRGDKDWKKLDKQRREDANRAEEWAREDFKRRREAGRGYYQPAPYGYPGYDSGGYYDYGRPGYQGYPSYGDPYGPRTHYSAPTPSYGTYPGYSITIQALPY
jgi:hypothetical protein